MTAALVALAPSACSLIVSTDDLTGGLGDAGALQAESGAELADEDEGVAITLGDAAPVSPTKDAGVYSDASTAADVTAHVDASDPSSADDSGTDSGFAADVIARDAEYPADAKGTKGTDGGCSDDLSNIGTGDFSIALALRTTQSGRAALVNQRVSCNPTMFWDLRLSSGELELETDDTTNYTNFTSTGPEVDDGASHNILIKRISGTVTIYVDETVYGSAASSSSFGTLAPLVTGTDVCDGQDGTAPFEGTITSVCVASL
jgi:hypothetical protein